MQQVYWASWYFDSSVLVSTFTDITLPEKQQKKSLPESLIFSINRLRNMDIIYCNVSKTRTVTAKLLNERLGIMYYDQVEAT